MITRRPEDFTNKITRFFLSWDSNEFFLSFFFHIALTLVFLRLVSFFYFVSEVFLIAQLRFFFYNFVSLKRLFTCQLNAFMEWERDFTCVFQMFLFNVQRASFLWLKRLIFVVETVHLCLNVFFCGYDFRESYVSVLYFDRLFV